MKVFGRLVLSPLGTRDSLRIKHSTASVTPTSNHLQARDDALPPWLGNKLLPRDHVRVRLTENQKRSPTSSLTQQAAMFPTRALCARSVWKGPNIVPLPIVRASPGQKVPPIKTQARSATILPNFVGLKFQIHNGKNYLDLTITEDMVGHKLGEFAPTRKNFTYKQTKNK